MSKKTAFIKILIFVGILSVPTMLWGLLSLFGLKDKLDFDLEEKRNKATISADVGLAELPGEIEKVYNDRVPFRSVLITFHSKINTALESNYNKKIEPVFLAWVNNKSENTSGEQETPGFIEEESTTPLETETTKEEETIHTHDFQVIEHVDSDYETYGYEIRKCEACGEEKKLLMEKLVDTSIFPYKTIGSTILGRYNWFFYETTMADYQGYNLISEADLSSYLSGIINLKQLCDSLGKEFYFIVLPNKNSVYPEYMPTVDSVIEKRRVQYIKEYLDNNSTIKMQYPLEEMKANKPYGQLYYKYDTHWSPYGYYIGVNALYTAMGLTTLTREDFEIEPEDRASGDLALLAGIDMAAYPMDVDGTVNYKLESDPVETLIGEYYIESSADAVYDRKIFIIGDSYRKGFLSFVKKDFTSMGMLDRAYKGNAIVEAYIRNSDIIVMELVERNVGDKFVEDVEYLTRVLSQ